MKKKNMGRTDKITRISIAILLGILIYANLVTGTLALILLAVAAIFIATSFISFCPLYTFFGYSSCPVEGKK